MVPPRTFSRDIPFQKMQGIGNDFVVVAARDLPDMEWSALAVLLCDRHFGVGSDGLLVLESSEAADFRMQMFNPDGTEDDCGNGLRCIARFARCHFWEKPEMTVETLSGIHEVHVLEHGALNSQVRVTMGSPRLSSRDIPMNIQQDTVIDYPIRVGTTERLFTCLYTGSTHSVTFLDHPVDDEVFQSESPLLEHHPLFPQRTSVLWTWQEGEKLRVRIWERGVGETLGCGTGACAVAVAARLKGLVDGPVVVASPGGELDIEWEPHGPIRMTGPATTVFTGSWPLETQ